MLLDHRSDIYVLDNQLNWNVHINFICNKLFQCVYMLRSCADNVPINVRIHIYFAFAQPYVIYGIECWGNATATNLNKVLVLQKHLIRYIYSVYHLTHCAPFALKSGILYVHDLYIHHLRTLAFKAFNNLLLPFYIASVFHRLNFAQGTHLQN